MMKAEIAGARHDRKACPQCSGRRQLLLTGLAAAGGLFAGGAASAPAALPGLIDIHHHAIPDFWFEAAQPHIAAQVGGRIGPQWTGWTPDKSLAAMDQQGVAMALLSISAPGTWFGDAAAARDLTRRCNDRLAQIAQARPDRFGFHATLALPDVEGSLREIDHAFDTLKADGIGLMTSYAGQYLGDPKFDPVFEALNRRKAVVYVHPVSPACCTTMMPWVSPNFIEFLHDTNRTILSVIFSGTLRRYPDIKFIFSHTGGSLPMMVGRVQNLLRGYPDAGATAPDGFAAELRKLHFDVANSTNRASFNAMAEYVPNSQVVFGTDFPIIPIEATAGGLRQLGLSAQAIEGIAQGNALRIYPQLAARMRR